MTESAVHTSAGFVRDGYDFNAQFDYLKKLIQVLKKEDSEAVQKEIFGDKESEKKLTKKEMKQLFRSLRKIEKQLQACGEPPIPVELENAIRSRDSEEWLPWELEAIGKIDAWREEIQEKKGGARKMLEETLAEFHKA